jgi:hypothetical protein
MASEYAPQIKHEQTAMMNKNFFIFPPCYPALWRIIIVMILMRVIFSMTFAPATHFDQRPFVFSERAAQYICKADAKS